MKWKRLGLHCSHCGKEIESRPRYSAHVVEGFEPMEHRHTHDKSVGCVKVTTGFAKPYNETGVYDSYIRED